jgi:hypothetical protein
MNPRLTARSSFDSRNAINAPNTSTPKKHQRVRDHLSGEDAPSQHRQRLRDVLAQREGGEYGGNPGGNREQLAHNAARECEQRRQADHRQHRHVEHRHLAVATMPL